MTLKKIQKLASSGESDSLEFKASTANLRSAFETICAFLNGKGGRVLIGVKDNGKAVGQPIIDKTKLEIGNEIKKIEPAATIIVDYIKIKDEQFVIDLKVNPGEHMPYVYDGRPFQRHESQTDRMSQHKYEQLLVERGHLEYSWEEAPASNYSIEDLDHEGIYKTVADGIRENRIPASAQREDPKQILSRLDLMSGNNLKRAAVVLYAKYEQIKFVQCMIKMARFKGTSKTGEFLDNQQIKGNSFRILFEADVFLRRHLAISSVFKLDQFKRIDQPTLPVFAVREALINAICHRDYSNRATDISLAIYDDRLEIWNSGSLLDNLTIENLKREHESILRNKLIANAFYVRGLIEKWGTGINRMIELCKKDNLPEPKFTVRSGGIAVIFNFKDPLGLPVKPKQNITDRQKVILAYLKNVKKASIQNIVSHLNANVDNLLTKRTIIRDLNTLKSFNLIDLSGEKRNAVWFYLPEN